jgi:hypothetical protein
MPLFVVIVYVVTIGAVGAYVYSVWSRKARLERPQDGRNSVTGRKAR